jgi:hypothetical protein
MKKSRTDPAGLSEAQQAALKVAIMKEFPQLGTFQEEVDFLVQEYNKDRGYLQRLTKVAAVAKPEESDESTGEIKTLAPGDPEYDAFMLRLEESQKKNVATEVSE